MDTDILKMGQVSSKGKYVLNIGVNEIWSLLKVLEDIKANMKNFNNATTTIDVWDDAGKKKTHTMLFGWSKATKLNKNCVQLIIESLE